jgi:hypothetical protein
VTITSPTTAPTYSTKSSSLTLVGTASAGVTTVTWSNSVGGGGTAAGTTNWSVPGIALTAGTTVFTVTASTPSGGTATDTLTVTYDTTAPNVTITAPAAGATVKGTTTVTAAASDNTAVVGLQFLLDGVALGNQQVTGFTLAWDTTTVANGQHNLAAVAWDAAGNTRTSPTITVSVANGQGGGPVAAYGFNEGSGSTTADSSGNGNTGRINGATWTTQGESGTALAYNGSWAYVDIGNGSTLRITGSMTISAWINSAAFPVDDAAIVSKRTSSNVGFQLDTTVDTGARTVGFKLTSPSGAKMFRYGATALQPNRWYYVTGVYDAAARTVTVYVNGQLDNGTQVGSVASAQQDSPLNVNIGRRAGNSGYAFNGVIDDVRIYNRALSQSEVQKDMTTHP